MFAGPERGQVGGLENEGPGDGPSEGPSEDSSDGSSESPGGGGGEGQGRRAPAGGRGNLQGPAGPCRLEGREGGEWRRALHTAPLRLFQEGMRYAIVGLVVL